MIEICLQYKQFVGKLCVIWKLVKIDESKQFGETYVFQGHRELPDSAQGAWLLKPVKV